jgi:hypothetical protein
LLELLGFICSKDAKAVIDLPLLPLADAYGTFAKFQTSSESTKTYFPWPQECKHPLFLHIHLVHPQFAIASYLNKNMNIAKLDGLGVNILIEEIISEGDEHSDMKQSDQAWINTFWSEFPMLKLENKALDYVSSFPLVPTMEPGKYIYISKCKNRSAVVFSTPDEPPLLWKFLTELGISRAQALRSPSRCSGRYSSAVFQHLPSYISFRQFSSFQVRPRTPGTKSN